MGTERWKPAAVLLLGALAMGAAPPAAQAPQRAQEALRSAFPEAERFDARDVLLTPEMAERIGRLARARVRERMVTFYTARRGETGVGYAVIHSHVVRTKRETFILALEPEGRIRKVEIVAFLEPAEYKPNAAWLSQLRGKSRDDRLAVGDDLAPISGATLSARGIAEQVRWLLQAFGVAVAPEARP